MKAASSKQTLSMWRNKDQRTHLGKNPNNCIHEAGTVKCVRICWQ